MPARKPFKNISPVSERWLHRVGIHNLDDLKSVGAENVYQMVLGAGHEPNQNLRCALLGAVHDLDWREVAYYIRSGQPLPPLSL